MSNTRFQEVRQTAKKSGACTVCGGWVTRSQTFWQSVNPWNRNDDGSVKSTKEVRESVNQEADAWVPDFTHKTCKPERKL